MYRYKDDLIDEDDYKSIYNFTITVKPFKSFYRHTDGKKTIYKSANQYEQYVFVTKHLRNNHIMSKCEFCLKSEEHQNKRLHYHGMIFCTQFEASLLHSMFNNFFGKSEVKSFETSVDLIKWNKYINKGFEMGEESNDWAKTYKEYKTKQIEKEKESGVYIEIKDLNSEVYKS